MPLKPKLIYTSYNAPAVDVPIVSTNVVGKGMLRIVGLAANTSGSSVDTLISIEIDGEVYVYTPLATFTGVGALNIGVGIAANQAVGSNPGFGVSNNMRILNIPFEHSLKVIVTPKYSGYQLHHLVDYILET